ncbi:MAG: hypothetical protein KAR83_03975 [Thermodesulfovibrionales bacterium]|nr:hypothetical protein [Thermodesulfovibrionales bacterium]
MSPEPTTINKATNNFRKTLGSFNNDFTTSFNILRQTSWLFLVPCIIMLLTYVLEFIRTPSMWGESAPPERPLGFHDIAWAFVRGITEIDNPFTTRLMEGQVGLLLFIPIMLILFIFQIPFKNTYERIAGEATWELFWPSLPALFIFSVIATITVSIPMFLETKYIDDLFFARIGYIFSAIFEVGLASFFQGGIVVGMINTEAGKHSGLREFLRGSAIYFKRLLRLNIVIFLIYSLLVQSYWIYYDYLQFEYSFPYDNFIIILFFAAPFLVVMSEHGTFRTLKVSAGLMFRHFGRFIAFFFLAGLVLLPFELFVLVFDSVIDPPQLILYLKRFALNSILLYASCIIALVFYKNIKRSLDEDAEEIA